jgi:hypothetical protein
MKGSGIIVELKDGRRGIVYRLDNMNMNNQRFASNYAGLIVAKSSPDVTLEGKVFVRICDSNNNHIPSIPGVICDVKNLKQIGFVN